MVAPPGRGPRRTAPPTCRRRDPRLSPDFGSPGPPEGAAGRHRPAVDPPPSPLGQGPDIAQVDVHGEAVETQVEDVQRRSRPSAATRSSTPRSSAIACNTSSRRNAFSSVAAGSRVSAAMPAGSGARAPPSEAFEPLLKTARGRDHAPAGRGPAPPLPPRLARSGFWRGARWRIASSAASGTRSVVSRRDSSTSRQSPAARCIAIRRQVPSQPLGVQSTDEIEAVDQLLRAAGTGPGHRTGRPTVRSSVVTATSPPKTVDRGDAFGTESGWPGGRSGQ